MSYILTDVGEEWYTETALEGATVTFSLYSDSTDAVGESTDIGDITTEPVGASYARQSDTVTVADISGNWGFQNSNEVLFDVSDSTQTIDGALLIVNFQSDEAGDSAANDHLIATAELSQSRDLSQVDEFRIEANEAGVNVN